MTLQMASEQYFDEVVPDLPAPSYPSNPGYCHCCREQSTFEVTGNWLRDQYLCRTCRSIPRQRHINLILDKHFPGWENAHVHESSPSNQFVARWCKNYSSSQYFDCIPSGTAHNGSRCENLEKLTFPKNTFDIFITQDVLEHVFDPGAALREIMRVLKPGGAHVFTAPKHAGIQKSYPRAKIENGKVKHLMEEMYHGNPVGDGRALVTWDYGDDFESLILEWCGSPAVTHVTHDRSVGVDGEYIEVFVIRKTSRFKRLLQMLQLKAPFRFL